jgi:N-acetylglucosaminyldiphosphoundecaprenol N-acetyl-beta-D-mannosaminyltransferase
LGSFITTHSYSDFVNQIFLRVENKVPGYVCFANVHMVVEAHRDPSFKKILNEADLVAPDGKPLSVFLRLAEGLKQERICGMDIFPDLLQEAESKGKSVFFYGTTPDLLNSIAEKALKEFPSLKIAG